MNLSPICTSHHQLYKIDMKQNKTKPNQTKLSLMSQRSTQEKDQNRTSKFRNLLQSHLQSTISQPFAAISPRKITKWIIDHVTRKHSSPSSSQFGGTLFFLLPLIIYLFFSNPSPATNLIPTIALVTTTLSTAFCTGVP